MTNTLKTTFAAAFVSGIALGGMAMADGETVDHIEVGSLSCDVGAGTGFVFGSTKTLDCTFNPTQEGLADERYVGRIDKYGIDIGRTEGGKLSWLVWAPTEQEFVEGGLNGTYGGLSAEATIVGGLGANVMTGGSENTLALQPVSLSTSEGLNIALGVGAITLERVDG
ncbi:DUF992 domain-containing protein [Sulfitobacter sp. TSTF-M16]|uniref:DUF992 domain-containing protein n=1 Tax=Sulfitobacter aestuariivivens TaxID=2766981 RepID=A0A927HCC3_9RHOB|nr:DUF992 domain-containing protein [Sulfitobacter aestuariivivens]MBD3662422.1 DUF992 domain-containing protein [Sulfitobacter aestuariivivens]